TKSSTQIDLGTVRGGALASIFYFANWQQIFTHQSYFAQFAAQPPLRHTWTLAIEEQFYLVWPLITLAILSGFGRSRSGRTTAEATSTSTVSSARNQRSVHAPAHASHRRRMEPWRRT